MTTTVMGRAELSALRRAIATIERRPAAMPAGVTLRRFRADSAAVATGIAGFDAALGGGLCPGALAEIRTDETREAAAAAGLALALAALVPSGGRPILWIAAADLMNEAGLPHAASLSALFGPAGLLVARARDLAAALWIAEEAAASEAVAAVLLEIRGAPARLDLTATRRLDRRAAAAGRPVFLLRHAAPAVPTAAALRLAVRAAPFAGADPLFPFGAAFAVTVEKSPACRPSSFLLEWNADVRHFVAAGPADPRFVAAPPVVRPGMASAPRLRLAS